MHDKRVLVVAVIQWLAAVAGTLGYVVAILPDYLYPSAWPLNLGFGIFLLLLWWMAFRGARHLAKPAVALGIVAVGLIVAGHGNVERATREIEAEVNRLRYERLALRPRESFRDDDALAQECERAFLPVGLEPPEQDAIPRLVRKIEERQPGWPRVMVACLRRGVVDGSPSSKYDEPSSIHGTRRFTLFRLTRLGSWESALRVEQQLMAAADADRERFLQAWKRRPPAGR